MMKKRSGKMAYKSARKNLKGLTKGDLDESFDVQKQVKGMSLDMGGAGVIGKGISSGKGKSGMKYGY